jgi:L-threonylcarbamoyladenylate synthase
LLDKYVKLIRQGEIVAFPTETVYGLGADAWNRSAIQKVFAQKGRPPDNPLIVHICSIKMAEDFANIISEDARKLMEYFWPGPLTLIFPKKPEVLDIITAGLDTVALRWPKHPLSQELISRTGPLVAPSANSSGKPSPTKAVHVKEDFGDDFPVIDAGETDIGLESTVLDISAEPYTIYRPGAVSLEEISNIIKKEIIFAQPSADDTAAKSPGTKYTHYSPQAMVKWLEGKAQKDSNALYLIHNQNLKSAGNIINYNGDYRRMAHELYDRFRQADHQHLKTIFIEPFDATLSRQPIVKALRNRISKAIGYPA